MGDFTLATPVAQPSKAKYVVQQLIIERTPAAVNVVVMVQDSGGTADIERATFTIPDPARAGATVLGFLGALINPRAGETGTNGRRANFRALGYLVDQGYLPIGTLNP